MTRPFSKWVWGGAAAFCTLVPTLAQLGRWPAAVIGEWPVLG